MLDVRKGEVYPTAHHEDTEGEYRKSSALSLTPVLEGGVWSRPHLGRCSRGIDAVPFVQ